MDYNIKVDIFEGPMDLLLNLIEENKLDIYDIPINLVTSQFLDYIDKIDDLNLEITGDFLIMASTLLEIKSRMLLPKEKIIMDDEEVEIDPREELVRRLEEYKLYKEISVELRNNEIYGLNTYFKPKEELNFEDDELDLGDLSLNKLIKTMNNIIRRSRIEDNFSLEEVNREVYTFEECKYNIKLNLANKKKCNFTELIDSPITKRKIIAYFLSVLELIRLRLIMVKQDDAFTDLVIMKRLD